MRCHFQLNAHLLLFPNGAHCSVLIGHLKSCTKFKFQNTEGSQSTMPNSKHRKRQLAANRKQIEKARKRLILQQEREKENRSPPQSPGSKSLQAKPAQVLTENRQQNVEDGSSWLNTVGTLYSWCHTGLVQVYLLYAWGNLAASE